MVKFKDRAEQERFIRRNNDVFQYLLNRVPKDMQMEAKDRVDNLYREFSTIYTLQPEKNTVESVRKDLDRV